MSTTSVSDIGPTDSRVPGRSTSDDDDLAVHLLALLTTRLGLVHLKRSAVGRRDRSHVVIGIEIDRGGGV